MGGGALSRRMFYKIKYENSLLFNITLLSVIKYNTYFNECLNNNNVLTFEAWNEKLLTNAIVSNFSFMTTKNLPLICTSTVLYRSYMFRRHLCHPKEALYKDLKLTEL